MYGKVWNGGSCQSFWGIFLCFYKIESITAGDFFIASSKRICTEACQVVFDFVDAIVTYSTDAA